MALPRFVRHNLGWKVASLAMAALLWLALRTGAQNRLKPFESATLPGVPIQVLTGPSESRSYEITPAMADVTVRGEVKVVRRLRPEDILAYVDLTVPSASAEFRRRVQAQLPSGVSATLIQPYEVQIRKLPMAPSR